MMMDVLGNKQLNLTWGSGLRNPLWSAELTKHSGGSGASGLRSLAMEEQVFSEDIYTDHSDKTHTARALAAHVSCR